MEEMSKEDLRAMIAYTELKYQYSEANYALSLERDTYLLPKFLQDRLKDYKDFLTEEISAWVTSLEKSVEDIIFWEVVTMPPAHGRFIQEYEVTVTFLDESIHTIIFTKELLIGGENSFTTSREAIS